MGARGFVIFKASLRRRDFKTGSLASCRALRQRQFCCIFELFHHEAGTDISQFDTRNEPLIQIVICLHIADARFDQIVLMPRGAIGRLHLRQAANDLCELIGPIFAVAAHGDGDKDSQTKPHLLRIQKRDACLQNTTVLQTLDPPSNRIAGQMGRFGQFLERLCRIALHLLQYRPVIIIKCYNFVWHCGKISQKFGIRKKIWQKLWVRMIYTVIRIFGALR